jgi:tetratricopeptide (TPR) repeat protein
MNATTNDTTTVLIYLILLIVLLAGASFFIFRQILRNRRTDSTLSRLQNKLNREKGSAQEYYELGSLLLDKKLYAQGVLQLQKSLKVAQDELKKLDKSSEEYADQLSNIALIYNALGYAYFVQEQYDLAIRQYKEAIKLSPGYVVALNNLANTYERKQLTNPALETYEEVLKYEPENPTAKRRAESLRKRVSPSSS